MNHIELQDALILDTETTGLDDNAEIVEISVIDASTGVRLFDSLIRPYDDIPAEASNIHGIAMNTVKHAPHWDEVYDLFLDVILDRPMIIYNRNFDIRLINQTNEKYGITNCISAGTAICAMDWYAEFYGEWDEQRDQFKWQSLGKAARQQGVDLSDINLHRAFSDCITTKRLIEAVNAKLGVRS